jgi:hypothetical protein
MRQTKLLSLIPLGALISALVLTISACSSQPIIPEAKNVKLSREDADKDCREIGLVQGTVSTTHGTLEQAIENMKLDAARRGANFIRMESTGAMGTSASGTAYQCP